MTSHDERLSSLHLDTDTGPRTGVIHASPRTASIMTVMISPSGSSKKRANDPNHDENHPARTMNVCVLCSCSGQTGLLALGGLHMFKSTKHFNTNNLMNLKNFLLLNANSSFADPNAKMVRNKANILSKMGYRNVPTALLDEFNKVGWQMENLKASDMFDLVSDSFSVHSNCFLWSTGILLDKETNTPLNIDKLTFESLTKKCSVCNLYGASIKCAVAECQEIYHYPCISLMTGSYLCLKTHKVLCGKHSNQAANLFDESMVRCIVCGSVDRPTDELVCTSCGSCYHGGCLWTNEACKSSPLVRIGWQCPDCKLCQACKKSGDDSHMLVCEKCDRCCHSYCTSRPVDRAGAWRCDVCEHQIDLVPTGSVSSANEKKTPVKNQTVPQEPTNKKRSVKDLLQLLRSNSVESTSSLPGDHSSLSQDGDVGAFGFKKDETTNNGVLATKQPNITSKKKQISKKGNRTMGRGGKRSSGTESSSSVSTRSTRSSKMSGANGRETTKSNDANKRFNSEYGDDSNEAGDKNDENDEPTIGHVKRDEDDHHAVTVIASLNDSFSLKQDMCLNCGSFGKADEGVLLSCSQCGQCFHTYCAGITNVGNVVRERGWRCLDCTVCEGCGKATDEGRLLLCDDCDISYHIYCLDPPLDQVPKGNWKCKWCVRCVRCGTAKLPPGHEWKNNYTECALCYSLTQCHVCNRDYSDADLISKCTKCDRWSHVSCDDQSPPHPTNQFVCSICSKPQQQQLSSLQLLPTANGQFIGLNQPLSDTLVFLEELASLTSKRNGCVLDEGVFLTDTGAELIKRIKIKPLPGPKRTRNIRTAVGNINQIANELDSHKTIDKQIDENSQSSNEDKTDSFNDEAKTQPLGDDAAKISAILGLRMEVENEKKQKRHINIGMGGFNLKIRSRSKVQFADNLDPTETENKISKQRKKKSQSEEMIPTYMQEAFFGSSVMADGSDVNFDEPENKIMSGKEHLNNHHQISLDENMFKMAQQNKKGQLELGIEDFLDGDIVSYLFNENRNLMEFNPEHDINNKSRFKEGTYDEKIFDEKIYADIFHQMVSDPAPGQASSSKNSVDDYLNLNSQNLTETINRSTPASTSSISKEGAETFAVISDSSLEKLNDDHRNIDNLARQFKESTRYVQNSAINDDASLFISHHQPIQMPPIHVQPQQQQFFEPHHHPNLHLKAPSNPPQQSQFSATGYEMKSEPKPADQNMVSAQFGKPHEVNQLIPKQDINEQKFVMGGSNQLGGVLEAAESKIAGFDDQELSNDAAGPKVADQTKHQKVLEKYAEDEDLGELATQAMSLYSNLNFPNLRNEIQDVAERYRHVHKIWRKLDSETKLNYINRSRQNRYKKKTTDDKPVMNTNPVTSTTTTNLARPKRPRSPSSNSDENCFSRSPSAISIDDNNEAFQHQHRNIEDLGKIKPAEFLNDEKQQKAGEFQPVSMINTQIQLGQPNRGSNPIIIYPLAIDSATQSSSSSKQEKITIKNYLSLNSKMQPPGATTSSGSGLVIGEPGIIQLKPTDAKPPTQQNDQNKPVNFSKLIIDSSGGQIRILNPSDNQIGDLNSGDIHGKLVTNIKPTSEDQASTKPQTSSQNEATDHIDSIINQVASGSGTIPYSTDIEEFFEEDTSSTIREFSNEAFDTSIDEKSKKRANKVINQLIMQDEKASSEKQVKRKKQKSDDKGESASDATLGFIDVAKTRNNSSPVKINELLMMNQQNYPKTATPIQFLGHLVNAESKNSNFYVIQPSPPLGPPPVASEKIVCKDDNLKKMLALPENDLLIENTSGSSSAQNPNNQTRNLLIKNLIIQEAEQSQNTIRIIPTTPGQPTDKFFQLDGAVDDPKDDQPSVGQSSQPTQSSSAKLAATKVVINHELLSSYGITLTPSPAPYPVAEVVDAKAKKVDLSPSTNSQMFIPIDVPKPQPQTNPPPKANLIKNLINQQQQQQQVMKPQYFVSMGDQKMVIPAEFYNNGTSQPVYSQPPPPPKVNGDNTLLKALLQTAPKNAIEQPPTPDKNQQYPVKSEPAPAPQPIAKEEVPINNSPPVNPGKKSAANPNKQNRQNKLMSDLKNKIIESNLSNSETSLKINAILENVNASMKRANEAAAAASAASNPKKQRKNIKSIMDQSSTPVGDQLELTRNRFGEEMSRLGVCNFSQPAFSPCSIDWPEKEHSIAIRKNLLVDLINMSIKLPESSNINLLEWALGRKLGCYFVKKNGDNDMSKSIDIEFKISSTRPDRPLDPSKSGRVLVDDSSNRLNGVLENGTDEPMDEGNHASDHNIVHEYFKKPGQVTCSSPLIDIEMPSQLPPTDAEKENTSTGRIKTVIKLSKRSGSELESTLRKLADFLLIESDVDLAKYAPDMIKPAPAIPPNTSNPIPKSYNETSFTLQTLQTMNSLCKFCESLIEDDGWGDHSGENKENKMKFCSSYCKSSYKKVLLMRRSSLKVAVQANSKLSLIMDTSANEDRSKRMSDQGPAADVIRWSPALAAEIFKAMKTEQMDTTMVDRFDTFQAPAQTPDQRVCVFCQTSGDQEANGPSRMLSMDVDRWSHLNCALWSDGVYETMNGSLMNVDIAFKKSSNVTCMVCQKKGASIKCFALKCTATYHLPCAIKDKCVFNQDKTVLCAAHAVKAPMVGDYRLTDLSVARNVWIQRDEVAQIQSFMIRDIDENHYAIRIGSLVLHNIGQLLPHQLSSGLYNNRDFIYPVGYKATRFYWSMKHCFKRSRYICSIDEKDGSPEFTVTIVDSDRPTLGINGEWVENDSITITDTTPSGIWKKILEKIERLRKENNVVKIFPEYLSGEYLFGLNEPHINRLIESLPGVETLTNYAFKFGRLQLLDMPLTLNPTGCARSEPKLRTHFRKGRTLTCNSQQQPQNQQRGGSSSSANLNSANEASLDAYNDSDEFSNHDDDYYANMESSSSSAPVSYMKQFSLSKSTQFKKLKAEWRSNVYLAKSQIQGLGLYAARDLEKNTMIIEYIGELIRNEVANRREKLYETQNRGVYMFRLNDDHVVDATISGGLARYINHCCDPNCIAETVTMEKEQKIIIIANKKILKGEELTYDYKFEFEDESNKIQCLCGSANCKKWMN